LSEILYQTDLRDVDWARMKSRLAGDDFDNGRTPEQLRESFERSHVAVVAYDGAEMVGTARALSDGVCNAYVIDVWTFTPYRRRGIARAMMGVLESRLRGQHVYLFTDDAMDFYRQLGFTERPTGMSKVVGAWLRNEP
jgi:GNAT superfamily N-acetyltransferase